MIDYQEIGNNIKICRIRCNLKQAELAETVGVTSQHISHVERCQTKPSLTLLVDISTALRVDLYTLLGSNIPVHPDVSISVEFASMLKDAAPEQVKLCLSVCKTIMEHFAAKLRVRRLKRNIDRFQMVTDDPFYIMITHIGQCHIVAL